MDISIQEITGTTEISGALQQPNKKTWYSQNIKYKDFKRQAGKKILFEDVVFFKELQTIQEVHFHEAESAYTASRRSAIHPEKRIERSKETMKYYVEND